MFVYAILREHCKSPFEWYVIRASVIDQQSSDVPQKM